MDRSRVLSVNRVFLITVIFSIIGSYWNAYLYMNTDSYMLIMLSSQLILILPSLIYIGKGKLNLRKVFRLNRIRPGNIILIILFSYLITPLMTFINALSMLFVENTTSAVMVNLVVENGLPLSLFMVALIPAIFEESVYRGIFYNEYRKVNPLHAIFLSAFLFGIIHLNLNQFAYAFAMGIVFSLAIEATDSIISTMIIHFFINGTSIFTLYIYPKILKALGLVTNSITGTEDFNFEQYFDSIVENTDQILTFPYIMETLFLPMIVFTALAIIVYRTIAKNAGRWEYVKSIFTGNKNKENLMSLSLIIGILICIILMITQEFAI